MSTPKLNWAGTCAAVGLAALTLLPLSAAAQDLPVTSGVMIVAATPGGGSDVQGRVVAAALEQLRPGLSMPVENHPGGSTAIGYTYLFQQAGNPGFLLAAGPSLLSVPLTVETPYQWGDFTPIAQIASDTLALVVREDAPYQSLADLVAANKESQLVAGAVASTGPDSIALQLLSTNQDTVFRRVVFEASGETIAALLAGDINFLIANPGEVEGQISAGTMRVISTFSSQRDAALPDVPTAVEQGVNVVHGQWRGIIAAGGISDEARDFWVAAMQEWSETPEYQKYLSDGKMIGDFKAGEAFGAFLAEQEQVLKMVTAQ